MRIVLLTIVIFWLSLGFVHAQTAVGGLEAPENGGIADPSSDREHPLDVEVDCESDWSTTLSLEDPMLLMEAAKIVTFWENAKRRTSSGLFKMECPPSGLSAASPFSMEVLDTVGSVDGQDAVGRHICENRKHLEFERMPDTPICRLAASQMDETGLGSTILGVRADADKQVKFIRSILEDQRVVIDGNLGLAARFVAWTAKLARDTAVVETVTSGAKKVSKTLSDSMAAADMQRRQDEVDRAGREAVQAIEERDTAQRKYEKARDARTSQSEGSDPSQEEADLKDKADQKSAETDSKMSVLAKIGSGECQSVDTCQPNAPQICENESCLQSLINQAIETPLAIIGLCERSSGGVVVSPDPLPQTVTSSAFESNFGKCKFSLSEDACHSAGSVDACEDVEITRTPEDLDDLLVSRVFIGGMACQPGDMQCDIVQKMSLNIPLNKNEQDYVSFQCTGSVATPSIKPEEFSGAANFDPTCSFINGQQICGMEAICLKVLGDRTYVTISTAKYFYSEFPSCRDFSSVTEMLERRFRLSLGVGTPLSGLLGPIEGTAFSARGRISLPPSLIDIPENPFIDEDELIPTLPDVGRANAPDLKNLVDLGATPKLDILVGLGDDEKFKEVVCGLAE